ncbi:hypothetical protein AgCh_022684 [Apium graveolens]
MSDGLTVEASFVMDWWELSAADPLDICKGARQNEQTACYSHGNKKGYELSRGEENTEPYHEARMGQTGGHWTHDMPLLDEGRRPWEEEPASRRGDLGLNNSWPGGSVAYKHVYRFMEGIENLGLRTSSSPSTVGSSRLIADGGKIRGYPLLRVSITHFTDES